MIKNIEKRDFFIEKWDVNAELVKLNEIFLLRVNY